MRNMEEIQADYAKKCATLGELVYRQRVMHQQAEEMIRGIEAIEQEVRSIKAAEATTNAPETAQE